MKKIFFRKPNIPISYNVILKSYDLSKKINTNILDYKISIKKQEDLWNRNVILFNRFDLLLNKSKDLDSINEILIVAGSVLNELELIISDTGRIHQIKNLSQIQKSWKEIKFKIKNTYMGDVVSKIVDPMDKTIHNEEDLIKSLDKDPFIHFYFNEIFGLSEDENYKINHTSKNFLLNTDMKFISEITIDKNSENEMIINTKQQETESNINRIKKELECKFQTNGSFSFYMTNHYRLSPEGYITDINIDHRLLCDGNQVKSLYLEVKQQNYQK